MPGGERSSANGRLIAALAGGATVAEAARLGGVSEATVYRRRNDDAFTAAVAEARAAMIERATARSIMAAAAIAVGTLVELLKRDERSAIRLGAARALLEAALRWRAAEELEARVVALESELTASRR